MVGYVFDTKPASCGEVLVAMKISQFAKCGFAFEDVVEKVKAFIEEMKTLVFFRGHQKPREKQAYRQDKRSPSLCLGDQAGPVCK
ncbi:MAG: hypothetical protein FWG10_07530 [Eubacteriaceae bacterium]|nr:hypothetical protein [Eubacteriaceae bacterium]